MWYRFENPEGHGIFSVISQTPDELIAESDQDRYHDLRMKFYSLPSWRKSKQHRFWFRNKSLYVKYAEQLMEILNQNNIKMIKRVTWTVPGEIIYQDFYQIAVKFLEDNDVVQI